MLEDVSSESVYVKLADFGYIFYCCVCELVMIKGARGTFPLLAIFTDILLWEICKKSGCGCPQAVLAISLCVYTQAVLAITPCVMTQAVLAVPEMESKWVLGCIGRLPKTHTGVAAHSDKKILKKFW